MKAAKPAPWVIDPKYKALLTLDDAKFIFDQAEKAFDDTSETAKKILDRGTTLLTLVSGLLVALVTYDIKTWAPGKPFGCVLNTTIVATAYYFVVGFLTFFSIKPKEYSLPGTQPKKYFVDELFDLQPPAAGRVLFLYLIEIKSLQERITDNRAVNNKRWGYYKISLDLLFASPAFIIIVYLLFYLLK